MHCRSSLLINLVGAGSVVERFPYSKSLELVHANIDTSHTEENALREPNFITVLRLSIISSSLRHQVDFSLHRSDFTLAGSAW